jgi:uncharacterized lipoprotein YajG
MNGAENRRVRGALLVAGALLLVGGCATNRGIMELSVPEDRAPAASGGKSVMIRSVTDKRVFEENPSDPSTPSLGFGGAGAATADERKRAIARKRNTYGKALGDILLKEGQSVETVAADLLKSSLRGMGYTVIGDRNQVKADTLVVDVTVNKFWAWFTPGFWALTLRSEIDTTVTVDRAAGGAKQQKTIAAKAEKNAQAATTGTWAEVYQRAFENYRANAKQEFGGLK